MSDTEDRPPDATDDDSEVREARRSERARAMLQAAKASATSPESRHVAVAVPIRAVERNRRVASSVLAGGIAYRLFLWLLPFGLILGGALGLSNTNSTEDAVARGGLPGAVANMVGDASRSAQSESWWLFLVGVPLLLWAGFSGAKAVQLVHALVWEQSPPKIKALQESLAFTGVLCAVIAIVGFTWWVREDWPGLFAPVITFAPLAALWLWVSLHLPHRDAPWTALVPGALLVSIGFQVLHEAVGSFLVPKLEKSTSLYGSLGATTTFIFFIYLVAILVVLAAVLNSSLYDELSQRGDATRDAGTSSPAGASPE